MAKIKKAYDYLKKEYKKHQEGAPARMEAKISRGKKRIEYLKLQAEAKFLRRDIIGQKSTGLFGSSYDPPPVRFGSLKQVEKKSKPQMVRRKTVKRKKK